jgi:hypothetical protein
MSTPPPPPPLHPPPPQPNPHPPRCLAARQLPPPPLPSLVRQSEATGGRGFEGFGFRVVPLWALPRVCRLGRKEVWARPKQSYGAERSWANLKQSRDRPSPTCTARTPLLSLQVVSVASPVVVADLQCWIRPPESRLTRNPYAPMSDESPAPAAVGSENSQPAEQATGGWGGWGLSVFSEISRNVSGAPTRLCTPRVFSRLEGRLGF